MHYFAYGSNMSIARLRARVPSAARLGAYTLREHDLRFHKVGRDGSGKCNAYHTGNRDHRIIGALFEIDPLEKARLDLVEGVGMGYEEQTVLVADDRGPAIEAFTYVASHIDDSLKPYGWYKHHVLVGAREMLLPEDYIRRIECLETLVEYDKDRERLEYAVHLDGQF